MNSVQKEYAIGAAFTLLGLLFLCFITPFGVSVPTASISETGSVTPRFFPNLCCAGIVLFGICQMVGAFLDWKLGYTVKKPSEPIDRLAFRTRGLSMLTLVSFYFVAEPLGIILTGFLFYILYAGFCGERNWIRAIIGGVICTLVLYYFFVYVAQVPMPAGLLSF